VLADAQVSDALIGVAAVDHSGRFGDRQLIGALGWRPGDQIEVEVLPGAAALRRSPRGRFQVDTRGHVFLPVATRTVLGLPVGGRVVLLAVPGRNLLMIHPPGVVTALLAARYRMIAGAADDR
jgi:bifunctional DNA-binding transcriptional regulator/antitoxin component of YhaV-PrlF toxin-antitoxin module